MVMQIEESILTMNTEVHSIGIMKFNLFMATSDLTENKHIEESQSVLR